ncbi:hypothetical protein BGW36DRAFT_178428 [Talaromyces proteolyticus]|uniref:Uncharacterized protein n=1 Tax=Talaromyces proteolyticus TaxID=1131652 RepID=A0AAD4KN99_9EURO|nr:uncharacterized protein BGW36DRAFT_178428 [Talaromyces proteolyticus]KAH8695934.1 hypothetical protein BGW36DRAFT_178428 [Talaromyces proteolyticus]
MTDHKRSRWMQQLFNYWRNRYDNELESSPHQVKEGAEEEEDDERCQAWRAEGGRSGGPSCSCSGDPQPALALSCSRLTFSSILPLLLRACAVVVRIDIHTRCPARVLESYISSLSSQGRRGSDHPRHLQPCLAQPPNFPSQRTNKTPVIITGLGPSVAR